MKLNLSTYFRVQSFKYPYLRITDVELNESNELEVIDDMYRLQYAINMKITIMFAFI